MYRFKQSINSIDVKYFNEKGSDYFNGVLEVTKDGSFHLSGSFQKLKCSFRWNKTVNLFCLTLVQIFGTKPWTHLSVPTTLIC